jgi:hypothetical protein
MAGTLAHIALRSERWRIKIRARREMQKKNWLSDMDSNHDKGLQRALCYHYTIGHHY